MKGKPRESKGGPERIHELKIETRDPKRVYELSLEPESLEITPFAKLEGRLKPVDATTPVGTIVHVKEGPDRVVYSLESVRVGKGTAVVKTRTGKLIRKTVPLIDVGQF